MTAMTCSRCGAGNHGDARFCGVCGAAVSSTEPASAAGEAPAELAMIGREIAGRYRMLAKLGEGGMGTVYRAEQISLKRTVAVKLLRPDVVGNQTLLRRFNAEAEAIAKLGHPNTVNIYDFGQDGDGTLFIAMEYIEGRSLRSVIQREGPLPPRRALAIAMQVAASLSDAHAHAIIHRDLKPDNVMLQERGRERDVARVLDFGIAKLRDDTRATQMAMTQQGDMLGTPQYMAPEQIRAEAIDGRTDIYALGCMLYEMVTARLPYEATTIMAMLSKHLLESPVAPSQRRPELGLPAALDELILAAMAKGPAARPPTMEAFSEQLAALYAALPPEGARGGSRAEAGAPAVAPTMAPDAPGGALGPRGPVVAAIETPVAYSAFPAADTGSPPSPPGAQRVAPGTPLPAYAPPSPAYAPPSPAYAPPSPAYAPPSYPPPYPSSPHAPALPDLPRVAPTHALPPRPASARKLPSRALPIVAIAVAVVAGGALVALTGLRAKHRARRSEPEHPVHVEAPPHEPSDHDRPPAPAPDTAHDRWGATSSLDGTKISVGQGVSVIIPSRFRVSVESGLTIAQDATGVLILAGPIDAPTDDTMQLVRSHARRNGMVFDSLGSIFVGGTQRPMAVFHGKLDGVAFRHIAVPLIGPGYRIVVMFQAPVQRFTGEHSIEGEVFELYTQRIVLP